jgi:hypothetical protein
MHSSDNFIGLVDMTFPGDVYYLLAIFYPTQTGRYQKKEYSKWGILSSGGVI